ncbi:MAG: glycosyltransferase family 4 protein [Acidimicrobiales bacterium]
MRILHVDKFLRRSGGAAGYMLDLAQRQAAQGHQVEFFAMADERNLPATYQRFFPPHVSLEPPPPGARQRLSTAGRMIWSRSAAKGMAAVVAAFEPDVVHLHNIYHQLSPSILSPVAAAGIPAVLTAHDYKLVCPTYRLLSHGSLCDACVGGRVWEATRRSCQGGSRTASAVLSIESGLHRWFKAYGPVQRFIAPSRFLADQLRRGGVFPGRIRQLNNYVDAASLTPRHGAGDGFVSIGRLSAEKGVDTLIEAVALLPHLTLTVAGEGPARLELEALAQRLAPGRVRFVGHVGAEQVAALNQSARAAVLAARWHENMPLSVLETMAAAVPMVLTSLGGLPELVTDGVEGLIVPPDDPPALARALDRLQQDPSAAIAMGGAAREKMVGRFGVQAHLERLFELYEEAAQERRDG